MYYYPQENKWNIGKYGIDYACFAILSFLRSTKTTTLGKWMNGFFLVRWILMFANFLIIIALGFILLRYVKNPKYVLAIMLVAYLILELLLS